jgi:uncharacterized protein (DUF58 family)
MGSLRRYRCRESSVLVTTPVPSGRLAVLAALAGLAILVLPDLGTSTLVARIDNRFLLANAAVLVLALLDVILAPSPSAVEARRVHPAAVTLGHTADIQWNVSQRRGRAHTVWLADELAPSLGADTRRVEVPVPARGVGSTRTKLTPTRRGRFSPQDLVVRTAGPLQLIYKQQRRQHTTRLRVLPVFRSAKEAELSLHKARVLEVGLRSARGRGGGTEFDSLRELSPDDETRRIDWAATARSNRPIVRTFRSEQNQTVLCLLDAGRVMAGRVEGVPRLEHAMDGAMLLAELATGLGDRMGLVAFDQTVHTTVDPSNRRSQRSTVTEAVFDLQPALAESNYRELVTHVMARYRRRTFLVLVTELVEEVVEEFLLPVLPLLMRTHLVVVAAVRDPDVDRWMTETTPDEDGAFLRAAALGASESRARVAARLRAKGAIVIDAEPSKFAAALGDAYLDAKAVGRL